MEMKNMEMLKELEKRTGEMDAVIIGGPTNNLVRHSKEGERGFGGERVAKVVRKSEGEEGMQGDISPYGSGKDQHGGEGGVGGQSGGHVLTGWGTR
jgi:hypothetical protein